MNNINFEACNTQLVKKMHKSFISCQCIDICMAEKNKKVTVYIFEGRWAISLLCYGVKWYFYFYFSKPTNFITKKYSKKTKNQNGSNKPQHAKQLSLSVVKCQSDILLTLGEINERNHRCCHKWGAVILMNTKTLTTSCYILYFMQFCLFVIINCKKKKERKREIKKEKWSTFFIKWKQYGGTWKLTFSKCGPLVGNFLLNNSKILKCY